MLQVLPGGLSYIGLPTSVKLRTVNGMAWFQACDWPSITANRSTGVSRRRVARAVASLLQGFTPHAHSRQVSRRLNPEAEDGEEHDDGGVSMAMKTNKVHAVLLYPCVWTGGTDNP